MVRVIRSCFVMTLNMSSIFSSVTLLIISVLGTNSYPKHQTCEKKYFFIVIKFILCRNLKTEFVNIIN